MAIKLDINAIFFLLLLLNFIATSILGFLKLSRLASVCDGYVYSNIINNYFVV